ncbi:MAG: sugar phosphate nucleotidyltransferase [Smithella sp.]
MQAIILAGGKGTRLKPYTTVLPKPLMPIGDYPILEIIIRQLKKNGFKKVTLAIGHQSDLFMAFFCKGEKWGIEIDYCIEEEPMGTAAPIRQIDDLDEIFLMMNGDILTDINYRKLILAHKENNADLTIATHKRRQDINYGTLKYNNDRILTEFIEKPSYEINVSMGIYVLSRHLVSYIPQQGRFDFPDLVYRILENKKKIYCHPYDGYWMDIGRPDDYEQAIEDYDKIKDFL